jgi:hypothetical protein
MSKRKPKRSVRQRAIVKPTMILKPRGMGGVLIQIARARAVVLAVRHAP